MKIPRTTILLDKKINKIHNVLDRRVIKFNAVNRAKYAVNRAYRANSLPTPMWDTSTGRALNVIHAPHVLVG